MTEAEWLACGDPQPLIESLSCSISERKVRLFALACCRRVGHLFLGRHSWSAIEVGERAADGLASDTEREAAEAAAFQTFLDARVHGDGSASHLAASAVWGAASRDTSATFEKGLIGYAHTVAIQAADATDQQVEERRTQTTMLRDIFGNPFRPVAFDPAWRTDTAVSLARGMYDSREFGAMPILADALQDAGCEDEQVLTHCRDANQVHVRGCWVCDLVLGKS